jgi:hypothetical protein
MRYAMLRLIVVLCLAACSRQGGLATMSPAVPAVNAVSGDRQILFGDLHVHSTYSIDAFVMNLPVMSGEGARPLSEACDYARYCSGLDFWSTTEHAESITPKTWGQIKQQMRECSAESAADGKPQTIVFTGFEWTQLGQSAATQYGHKNVIFKSLADDKLPPRPIAMGSFPVQKGPGKLDPAAGLYILALLDIAHPVAYTDLSAYMQDLQRLKACPAGVDTRKLPKDCQEVAPDSTTLFEKLNQGGYEALVIPHGTAWGLHVPHLTDWKSQLTAAKHDALRQRLFEVYSGHGSSEQVKTWNEPVVENGKLVCPLPSKTYLPCCYQAGEIVRKRCADATSAACEAEVAAARQKFVDAGQQGFRTVKGATPADWLNCGQCTDCFSPAFNYRPNGTAQRALAATSIDPKTGKPMHFTWGFIGSSDTHRASPGSGVVETRELADGTYPANSLINAAYTGGRLNAAIDWEFERQASFWYTGGLAAVHATAKTREAIWDALQRRETYATSGPRILLWFDLLNDAAGAKKPMGAEAVVAGAPSFEVRAVGAFRQKPGCPPDALGGGADVRERICRGACYNPSDERIPITRLEIIKVRPQVRDDEPMDGLVQDPWRVIPCADQGQGCKATFSDEDFAKDGRYSLYYVRAVQEATPGVNSGGLRCEYDAAGRCVKVNPCFGDYRTAKDDQCFSPTEERAWSSPIYVTPN